MTGLNHGQTGPAERDDCLGSTCMKWTASGELSSVDLGLIMERLSSVDANLKGTSSCSIDELRCQS